MEWKGIPGLRRDGQRRSLAAHGDGEGSAAPGREAGGRVGAWACRVAVPGLGPSKTGEKSRFQNEAGR